MFYTSNKCFTHLTNANKNKHYNQLQLTRVPQSNVHTPHTTVIHGDMMMLNITTLFISAFSYILLLLLKS